MNTNYFWLMIFMLIKLSGMQEAPEANFEITTFDNQTKSYKCLRCDYRPVKRETSLLNHWVRNHNKTWDYTIELWKEMYVQCNICRSYHHSTDSLKIHKNRNHNPKKLHSKHSMNSLERNAIMTLTVLSQHSKN